MDIDTNAIYLSFLWGTVAMGVLMYAKKTSAGLAYLGGFALLADSYFCTSSLWMSLVAMGILGSLYYFRGHFD